MRGFGGYFKAIYDQDATKAPSLRYKALYIADVHGFQFILTKGRRHTAGAIVLGVDGQWSCVLLGKGRFRC